MKLFTNMQLQDRNILMLITNLGKGGAQRVFYDHSIAFSEIFNVKEVVFDIAEDERLYNSGLPIFSLNVKAAANPLQRVTNFFKRARSLRKIIRKEKINITISHMDGANWVNALSHTNERKILVVHGTVLHDKAQSGFRNYIRRKLLLPYLYNKADVTVAVSEGICYELKNFCGVKNAISIPNFFDIKVIEDLSDKALPEEYAFLFSQYKILITSGRFAEQKKHRHLIPVFKKVREQFADAKLLFLGDGELRKEMVIAMKEAELSLYNPWNGDTFSCDYDVYMVGYVSNPFAFLSKSLLFLFPSGWEGFPMALCEAMICGVPVLSADCPTGPREILAPGTFDSDYNLQTTMFTAYGVLLPMADKESFVEEWFQAINLLIEDGERRMSLSSNAKERMKKYDKKFVLKQWEKLLLTVKEG